MNGAEVLGAWFKVDAPELTDGAAPTISSQEYTGPITLDDSTTIRAVAFSDAGLESREYSATFSLMSVAGAVAKPRYPWNGKVETCLQLLCRVYFGKGL